MEIDHISTSSYPAEDVSKEAVSRILSRHEPSNPSLTSHNPPSDPRHLLPASPGMEIEIDQELSSGLSQMLQGTSLTSLSHFLEDLEHSKSSIHSKRINHPDDTISRSFALESIMNEKTPREISYVQHSTQVERLIKRVEELERLIRERYENQSISNSETSKNISENPTRQYVKKHIESKFEQLEKKVLDHVDAIITKKFGDRFDSSQKAPGITFMDDHLKRVTEEGHSLKQLHENHHNSIQKTIENIQNELKKIESDVSSKISKLESEISSTSETTLGSRELRKIRKALDNKLDAGVIEELMRHIATREELKQLAELVQGSKTSRDTEKRFKTIESSQKSYLKLVNELKKASSVMIKANIAAYSENTDKQIRELSEKYEKQLSEIKRDLDYIPNKEALDVRQFEGRLEVLYGELSACKQAWHQSIRQPFYRCAQWVWKSGVLKFGTAVPWNIETTNTDPENFIWEEDATTLKISEGGLYEISFAFFTKTKPSIQILINGESVLSAINSPSYVVHHSSGYLMNEGKMEPGTVTGISLVDFLAVPFKSTIALHYHGGRKGMLGHGFLALRKL